jgi:hypothetical protein
VISNLYSSFVKLEDTSTKTFRKNRWKCRKFVSGFGLPKPWDLKYHFFKPAYMKSSSQYFRANQFSFAVWRDSLQYRKLFDGIIILTVSVIYQVLIILAFDLMDAANKNVIEYKSFLEESQKTGVTSTKKKEFETLYTNKGLETE